MCMNVYLIVCTGQCNTTLSGIQPTETASGTAMLERSSLEAAYNISNIGTCIYMYMQVM